MPYINDPGYEVPENTIGYWTSYPDSYIDEVLQPEVDYNFFILAC